MCVGLVSAGENKSEKWGDVFGNEHPEGEFLNSQNVRGVQRGAVGPLTDLGSKYVREQLAEKLLIA